MRITPTPLYVDLLFSVKIITFEVLNLKKRKVKKDEQKSNQLLLDVDEKCVFRENCEPRDELLNRLNRLGSGL